MARLRQPREEDRERSHLGLVPIADDIRRVRRDVEGAATPNGLSRRSAQLTGQSAPIVELASGAVITDYPSSRHKWPSDLMDPTPRNGHSHLAGALGSQIPDIRILIVDDSKLHRENLAAVFAVDGATPAVAGDLRSLSASLCAAVPDVVLMNMGSRENMTSLRWMREKYPQVKVIALGISDDDEAAIVACAEAGVAGYHLRNESLDDLVQMISKVIDGEPSYPATVCMILMKRLSTLAAQRQSAPTESVLTAREAQILRLLERGMSNREIADRLCIALHTVKNHVHSVLGKLGVSTRCEAAAVFRSSRQSDETYIKGLGAERV